MMSEEKEVIWMGSSLKDVRAQPKPVQRMIGYALGFVQEGESHTLIKPLRGRDLAGVFEIRADYDRDTYRAVYAVNLGDRIYMLHVFKKKSKRGIETPKPDIRTRLKQAKELAKELNHE
jgi:phage-related protein